MRHSSESLENPSSSEVEEESHFHQRLLDGNRLISSSSASTNFQEYRRTEPHSHALALAGNIVIQGSDEQRRISATATPSPAIAQFQPSSSPTERPGVSPRIEQGSRPITPVPDMLDKDDYFNGRIGEDEEEIKRIKKRWRMEI